MDEEHEIDIAVAAIETELEIFGSKQKTEEVSDDTRPVKTSGCGCTSLLISLIIGIVLLRLILEVFSFFI